MFARAQRLHVEARHHARIPAHIDAHNHVTRIRPGLVSFVRATSTRPVRIDRHRFAVRRQIVANTQVDRRLIDMELHLRGLPLQHHNLVRHRMLIEDAS